MKNGFTLIEAAIVVAILLIIAATAISVLMDAKSKRGNTSGPMTIGENFMKVREWTDEKTGKRYLVFDRYNGGLFVIEAPLTVEKK